MYWTYSSVKGNAADKRNLQKEHGKIEKDEEEEWRLFLVEKGVPSPRYMGLNHDSVSHNIVVLRVRPPQKKKWPG